MKFWRKSSNKEGVFQGTVVLFFTKLLFRLKVIAKNKMRQRTKTIQFSTAECKFIDIYNSLLHKTEDVIRLKVSGSQFLTAEYLNGESVLGQVGPWWHIQEEDI